MFQRFSLFRTLFAFLIALACMAPSWAVRLSYYPNDGDKVLPPAAVIRIQIPFGSNLPYRDAQMWIDDQEVSDKLQKNTAFVAYQPVKPMAPGVHKVRFVLGGEELKWSFEVESQQRVLGLRFKAPKVLQEFDEVQIEMLGERGHKAWANVDGHADKIEMVEVSTGRYAGRFSVPPNFKMLNAKLSVTMKGSDFEETRVCPDLLKFSAAGFRVVILGPALNQPVREILYLEGRTRPGSTVSLNGNYDFPAGVEVVDSKDEPWEKVVKQTMTADAQGYFRFVIKRPDIRGRLLFNLGLEAKSDDGQQSELARAIYLIEEKSRLFTPRNLPGGRYDTR